MSTDGKPQASRSRLHGFAGEGDGRVAREPRVSDLVPRHDPALRQIIQVLVELQNCGYDLQDPETVDRAIEGGRRKYERTRSVRTTGRPQLQDEDGSLVYYMRIGNRVKIGFSTNLAARLEALNPEELVATEPGGRRTEQERHGQFSYLRTHGEWFELRSPLIEFIEALREDDGVRHSAS